MPVTRLDNGDLRRLYGRRKGHPLTDSQEQLVSEWLPKLQAELPSEGFIHPSALFNTPKSAYWLEIGFGKGEHLCAQASANPDVGLIGCEPFWNGVAGCIQQIAEENQANIRLHPDDAREVLDHLESESLDRVFVLHPDPWPKRRHAKRRLFNPFTLDQLGRVMKDGAELRLATDDDGYSAWALMQVMRHPDFDWPAQNAADWRERPTDWPQTRYGEKARQEGRSIVLLRFIRKPRAEHLPDTPA